MSTQERALAAAVSLKAHMPLTLVYEAGYPQFLLRARKIYRNYGFGPDEIDLIWGIIERWYRGDPSLVGTLGRAPVRH